MSNKIDLDILGMGAARPALHLTRPGAETANQNIRLAAMQAPAGALEVVKALPASDAQGLALVMNSTAQAVADQVGYVGTMSVGALEDEIRFYQRRTVEAILETGKRLLVLKELTPHGEFTMRVELLGFHIKTAQRFMQAASKTAKNDKLSFLSTQVKSTSAFLELVTHDDDVIEDLSQLDDIDRMSASQLRTCVRQLKTKGSHEAEEERQRANRLEVQLEAKEDLIDTLKASQVVNPSYSMETNVVRQQTALLDGHCAAALDELGTMANALSDEAGLPEGEFQARFHSLWFSSQSVLARAMLLIERLREMGDGFIPESVEDFKAGLLTADEANHYLAELSLLRTTLASRHTNIKTAAQDAAPRKAGRPKGSPNKAKE